ELTRDACLEVWKNASSFKGSSQVSTWILSIARYKALAALRRRANDPLDDEIACSIPDDADGPEAILQKQNESSVLRQCLTQLSPAQREVIDLAVPGDHPRGLRRSRADRHRRRPIRRRNSPRSPRCARHDRGARDGRPARCRCCFAGLLGAASPASKTTGPARAQLHPLALSKRRIRAVAARHRGQGSRD